MALTDAFNAIVIGMGPGGEVAADRLLTAGKRVAVVERELIGGECAYWACIPSKAVLRPPEAVAAADRIPGTSGAGPEWAAVRAYRDDMIRQLDDLAQVDGYQRRGAMVIKGNARITGLGRVEVDSGAHRRPRDRGHRLRAARPVDRRARPGPGVDQP